MGEERDLIILSGRAHQRLTEAICEYLQIPLGRVRLYNFSDGENACQIEENVRGADVFVVQPTCPPVNDNLMELLILLDACRRSSATRTTAVIPYFGYARQDRKDRPRVPITAKLVCDLLTSAGASRILAVDLHAAQIQGFFNIPVDHLFAAPVLIDELRRLGLPNLVMVSPDAGGVERARAFAKRLTAGLAIVDKRRTGPNQTEVMHIIGDVEGRTCVIVDDIIDTAGTLVKTAEELHSRGAARIIAAGVHPVLSGPALDRIEASVVEEVIVTDTIPSHEGVAACRKIRQLSVAELLGEAILRIHEAKSVSSLFV
jgi:ribose-phosphate pyrophosphokinase